ncbi:DNA primase (bacterial type) [Clostridioides difficile]|nr:DNA primase (bacterial type) [Clostridioides difficile]
MEIKDLTNKQIINFMEYLGSDLSPKSNDRQLIFNTHLCHNGDSYKLFYYTESKTFHCYSSCGHIGSLIDLLIHIKKYRFKDAVNEIKDFFGISNQPILRKGFRTKKKVKQDDIRNIKIELLPTPKKPYVYKTFQQIQIEEWENENISFEVLRTYQIHYNPYENQIVIPHFCWHDKDRPVGIRVRNLDEDKANSFGKYIPLWYDNRCYNHRLSLNLYGLNINKQAIKKSKKVIVFEGEKSVLQMATMYKNNPSVAICGSNFSKEQKKILIDLGVEELIIAFDRQFKVKGDEEYITWRNKIYKSVQDIKEKLNISVIWDKDNLLEYKNSPSDLGKFVFERLLKSRINIDNLINN